MPICATSWHWIRPKSLPPATVFPITAIRRASSWTATAHQPNCWLEFDDLLERKPDAVVVASNGRLQVEHACMALEAGCHVLSEVPGADTEHELIRLRDAVERTGLTYMLAENACYAGFLPYWRKWVLEDRFGPISIAEAEYLHYLPETLFTPDGKRLSPHRARSAGAVNAKPIWRRGPATNPVSEPTTWARSWRSWTTAPFQLPV